MENNITTMNQSVAGIQESSQCSLMEIRMDKRRFPRLHQYTRDVAIARMNQIVLTAFQWRGQTSDTQNISFIANALVDELMADTEKAGTRNITFEEIGRCVKRAVLGQSKEMFGISVASLYQVIMDYIKGEGHEIEKRIRNDRETQNRIMMKESMVAPMLQSYSGELVRKKKI